MSYFAPYIDETGLHMPTYEERLEALCGAYRGIFGADAALSPSVPDYQLLSAFAKALDDTSALVLQAYNSRNPLYARGQALDLLMPLYGLSRRGATYSEATVTFTCSAACVIPTSARLADANGYLWQPTEEVSVAAAGDAEVPVQCLTPGPIYAAAGAIASLVTPISGVTSITNAAASSLGLNEETDAEVRVRIAAALSGRANTIADALLSALKEIPNVRSCILGINDTDSTDSRNIPAHSLAVVIMGGNTQKIADTIFAKKAPGIGTYGTSNKTVVDENGDSHIIYFSRPSIVSIYPGITLKKLAGFDEETIVPAVKNAVKAYLDAQPVAQDINIPMLYGVCYGAVPELASTFVVKTVSISTTGAGAQNYTDLLPLDWNQMISVSLNAITITLTT